MLLLFKKIYQVWQRFSFTTSKQQTVLEDIAALLEDGVPINQAIDVLLRIASSSSNKTVLQLISRKIGEGYMLADGIEDWYPLHIVEIIRAGEASGALTEAVRVARESLSKRGESLTSFLNSLTYPILVVIAGMALAVFLNHSVFHDFALIKPVVLWPSTGQAAYQFANIIQHTWWLILMAFIAIIFLIRIFLNDYIGTCRQFFDHVPVLSLYRKMVAARLMETLGLLIGNGIVLKNALQILSRHATPYLASHIMVMEYHLSGGHENIAEVLDTGLIDLYDLERLRAIAKGRGFDQALTRQGMRSMANSVAELQLTARILGGMVLTGGAMLAAFLILAVYGVGSILAS